MTEDKSVIISTHQVRDIDNLLDHIIIIANEKLMLNASNEDNTYSNSYSSRRNDSYDVYNYDDPDDFAGEWEDEFDDGYDEAYDYWEEEHD